MGFLDFLLTTQQKQNKVATRIALDSGLFVMCPVCHGVTESRDPQVFRDKTEALVHKMVSEKHPDAALFANSEVEIHKTIARVARDLPYHCICESI
ncbi:MAG: hypothetical protein ABFR65_11615 [Pseudomonadota bacterium]